MTDTKQWDDEYVSAGGFIYADKLGAWLDGMTDRAIEETGVEKGTERWKQLKLASYAYLSNASWDMTMDGGERSSDDQV